MFDNSNLKYFLPENVKNIFVTVKQPVVDSIKKSIETNYCSIESLRWAYGDLRIGCDCCTYGHAFTLRNNFIDLIMDEKTFEKKKRFNLLDLIILPNTNDNYDHVTGIMHCWLSTNVNIVNFVKKYHKLYDKISSYKSRWHSFKKEKKNNLEQNSIMETSYNFESDFEINSRCTLSTSFDDDPSTCIGDPYNKIENPDSVMICHSCLNWMSIIYDDVREDNDEDGKEKKIKFIDNFIPFEAIKLYWKNILEDNWDDLEFENECDLEMLKKQFYLDLK